MNHISNFDIQSLTLGENEPLAVTNRGTMASPALSVPLISFTPEVRPSKDPKWYRLS